ncbi:hypothetical protein CBS470a_006970 [Colletotrichum nupharicola]|nr:hypothetical protein CBS470a_006970 [Colletotrichum nupharicola]
MFSLSSVALLAFLCVSPGSAAVSWNFRRDTSGPSVWDYSPNFSNDTFPPWPPLEDDSGKRIDVANLRGTRLFGWEGCTAEDANKIKEAWEDRWNLVKDDDIKKNINWKGQAAEEFWGPPTKIPDYRKQQIQQYFMETPKKADYVRDLKMSIKNVAVDAFAYGPYYARILRNWNKNPGYYTQKNAAPRDEDGNSLNSIDTDPEEDPALAGIAEIEHEGDPDFKIPGCADKFHVADENPPPPYTAECSADPGAVPYNVFAGQSGNVFGDFCDGIDTAKDLKTTVDASGKVIKRTPPPNPATWKNYKFHLEYAAGAGRSCKKTCNDAFQSLKAACGSKGGE